MKNIANLLFKAKILKDIPRSGYHFLGVGKESVAEHSFTVSFIAFVMSQIEPDVDALRLIAMSLVHDLPEAKTGDLNYVQKKYVAADENKAVQDITRNLPFGTKLADLIKEFNECRSIEAKLAHDADQLALILDLKSLSDIGYEPPKKWLPYALQRLQTKTGRTLADSIMHTEYDAWWLENYVDSPNKKE
ncbi:MAG: HD domain-containing protein [Deltaproteobacteria bacterium]|nr:HD domain-containing protein [Deltaproteobacteria bacterium]MBW1957981.1 HD domain-containing protein [Deltaproteobacteria bacterium]MBW2014465.1 HD domain-containing protein [Deltaproteobacteria bacterium]MBW2321687.1 HD domain-containing protein [Deltaproteobacteria bacterium]